MCGFMVGNGYVERAVNIFALQKEVIVKYKDMRKTNS